MDINQQLYRNIKSGFEYESLIPKTTCQPTQVGKGMTDFSVDRMVDVVKKYGNQAEKVAKKLQSSSLEKTLQNIHQFIYWHFAYKADTDDQLLRSFACSWYDRKNGIDCKSYSIAASSLLSSLGIKHYIRKIKQPSFAPTEWTHVYVVVPKNQQTGSLSQGYFTIDGTLADFDREPKFKLKKDKNMMNHVMLNGAHLRAAAPTEEDVKNFPSNIKNALKKPITVTSFGQIGKLWSSIKGFFSGGGWYTDKIAEEVSVQIFNHFNQKKNFINQLLKAPNFTITKKMTSISPFRTYTLTEEISEFLCHAQLIADTYYKKRYNDINWGNETDKNLEKTIYTANFYKDAVARALENWVNDNFIKGSQIGESICNSAGWEKPGTNIWKGMHLGNSVNITNGPIYALTPKKPVAQIPDFQINEYLRQQYEAKGVNSTAPTNIAGYLGLINETVQGIQNTIQQGQNLVNPIFGNDNAIKTPNTGSYETIDIDGTKNAGASTAVKVVVTGIVAKLAYDYFTKKS